MFTTICDLEYLLNAYRLARRDNRYKRQSCKFDLYLEENLLRLKWDLETNHYTPSPYAYFIVKDPKTRHVAAPKFRDRVFQHALVSVIEPFFDKTFIEDAYACRKGKGTHFAMHRMKKFLQAARSISGKDTPIYILQCDISKFFPSISWDILISLIQKKINDPKVRSIIIKIITMHEGLSTNGKKSLVPKEVISIEERKGLPIGNLTSQLFANVYLNQLDHFVKENLRERWYGRYMDDFFIISPDSKHLVKIREIIRGFTRDTLGLTLHQNKSTISNVKEGVAFVGYRVFYDHVLIRACTLLRYERKLKKKQKLVRSGKIKEEELLRMQSSFSGHLQYANAWNLRNILLSRKKTIFCCKQDQKLIQI